MSVNKSKENRYTIENMKYVQEPNYNIIEAFPSFKINDIRTLSDFKKTIIGGYLKSQALSTLTKSIETEKIENAVYIGLLLFFSGHINQLWNKLINIAAKNINIANPNLPVFIMGRHKKWNNLIKSVSIAKSASGTISNSSISNNFMKLRNSIELRNYLCEMISYLCLSRKVKLDVIPKIKDSEFEIGNFKKHLEAKDTSYTKNIIKENDPSEITIACNEFAYHLTKRNTNKSLYWLSWIMTWDKNNIKKYGKFEVHARHVEGIDSKYSHDIVWLIWETINVIRNSSMVHSNVNDRVNEQIDALFKLYCYDFTIGQKGSKLIIIEWAIKYLTNIIDWKIPLLDRKYQLYQIMSNIEIIINDIKKDEETGNIYKNEGTIYNLNIIDNYMLTQKHDEITKKIADDKKKKDLAAKQKFAKKNKISMDSLRKLEFMNKFDGFN